MPPLSPRDGVTRLLPGDHAKALEVWEASVRATHYFLAKKDARAYRRLVRYGLFRYGQVHNVRDRDEEVVGFIALGAEKVEMLFVHPNYRAVGVDKRLMR